MTIISTIAACILSATALYPQVKPAMVWTLLATEGGKIGHVSRNTNGTEDHGPMQINTIWLKPLAKHYRRPEAEIRDKLVGDPCFNIAVGTWILAQAIEEAGGDPWRGIAYYHSRTPRHMTRYVNQVSRRAQQLYGPDVFSGRELPVVPPNVTMIPVIRQGQ